MIQKMGTDILIINQAIQINDLSKHLLYPVHCCLNDMHIREVTKFLADSPSVTTHAIQLLEPFDAPYLIMIMLQLSGVTSYVNDSCHC